MQGLLEDPDYEHVKEGYEAAHNWYHSEEYAEAKALRMSASTSVQTIVEGV